MTVALIPVELKAKSKCSKCGHELLKGWFCYATVPLEGSKDKPKTICRFCAPKMGDSRIILLEILNTLQATYQQGKVAIANAGGAGPFPEPESAPESEENPF